MSKRTLTVLIEIPIPDQAKRKIGLRAMQYGTMSWIVREAVEAFMEKAVEQGLPTTNATYKLEYVNKLFTSARTVRKGKVVARTVTKIASGN